ncbi:uncharacterized protein LOC111404387 [Olea europaea var. sylvestris]|uniref:uncharacterized protein LOC111404387 n=1 Tax=Olea europaea var. sylvestris TaxID=158386 RepID=UPI000C1D8CE3|nr:uncharacterized protein LOC111404387 [Olea europaea var. sylvestris]
MPLHGTRKNCARPYVSTKGLEVDRAKIDTISKLPPTYVKGIRSFLGHAGFYKRFIRDFSKVAKPLCNLLEDTTFMFHEDCLKALETIKKKLVTAPMMAVPNIWEKKGNENVVADHLSRLENEKVVDESQI